MKRVVLAVGGALLLAGCGASPAVGQAGGVPRPVVAGPVLPTARIATALRARLGQARAQAVWRVQALAALASSARATIPKTTPTPTSAPRTSSPPPAASPPSVAAGLPMRDIPVYDPVNAYQQSPPAGAVVGFVTTINTTTLTATIGPGWVWNPTLNNGQGGFAEIYPGGTVSLPATLTPNAYGGYDDPQICEIYPTGDYYSPVTVGVYDISAADPVPTGPDGIDGTCFAQVGQAWIGPGYNLSFSQPVWESFENDFTGLVWSGGTYGSGTPSITGSATPASGS